MRCFIALPIPEETKAAIAEATSGLRRANPGLRWASHESYHLTLSFLGEIDAPRLECAKKAADSVSGLGRFTIDLGGLLRFPARGNFRVLSLDILTGVRECVRVYTRVNEALAEAGREAGFASLNPEWPKGRLFAPHLTLARAGREGRPPNLDAFPHEFQVSGEISSCIVYESVLGRGGAVYTPLHVSPLAE